MAMSLIDPQTEAPQIVLAAQDDPLRTRLEELLSEQGYRVFSCACASELLTELRLLYAAQAPPALVIVEETLPGVGGLEAISHARVWGWCGKIVLLAPPSDRYLAAGAARLGVVLLHAPVDEEELRHIAECAVYVGDAADLSCAACGSTEDLRAAAPSCDVFFCAECSDVIASYDRTDPLIDVGCGD